MKERKELYIDFDGVVLDTIPIFYEELKKANIDHKDQVAVAKYLKKFDYSKVITEKYVLQDSINCIQKLIDSNKFVIALLTHVHTLEEGVLKIEFIRKYFKDITVILVPKVISKTKMVHTEGAILVDDYAGNLREWEKEGGIGVRFSLDLESKGFKVINKLDQLLDIF